MKEIELSRGAVALIDDADYKEVSRFRWFLGKNGYAHRSGKMKNRVRGKNQYLHRLIMGDPVGLVDHINQNKLDCRRQNLRVATKSLNALNSKVPTDNTSGFKGVDFDHQRKKWSSRIKVNGKQHYLGRFEDKLDAVRMRALAERWFSHRESISS